MGHVTAMTCRKRRSLHENFPEQAEGFYAPNNSNEDPNSRVLPEYFMSQQRKLPSPAFCDEIFLLHLLEI